MTEVEKIQRRATIVRSIMNLMVESGFTVSEAEQVPGALSSELRKNSERWEKEKPFAVYLDS